MHPANMPMRASRPLSNNVSGGGGMVEVNAVPMSGGMPPDVNPLGMQMPNLMQQQHPSMTPMSSYDVSMTGTHPPMSPAGPVGAENLMDSMEPPLKFEEDEDAWNGASPDEFIGFYPTPIGAH